MDLRRSLRENSAQLPELLTQVWPNEEPKRKLSEELSNQELFEHYLYFDGQREKEHAYGLVGEWNRHFHQYSLTKKALEAGAMDYSTARGFLHEALAGGRKQNIAIIYIFWLDELKKYEGQSMDVYADRLVTARRALESIREEKNATYRAELTAFYVEVFADRLSQDEKSDLIREAVSVPLGKLPKPEDVTDIYVRHDVKIKSPRSRHAPHGNDMHWLLGVIRVGNSQGLTEEVRPLEDYLISVLKVYDPAVGEPYFTKDLLWFAANNDRVPRKLREYYRGRVASAVKAHQKGLSGQDTLLDGLIRRNFDLGYYKSALKALKNIQEETSMLHAASVFMGKEIGGEADPDYIYNHYYLPLVIKKWGRSNLEDENHMWKLQWVLTAAHTDDTQTKTRIFNRPDVLSFIESGEIDSILDTVSNAAGTFPGDERLVKAIRLRVRELFKNVNGDGKKRDDFSRASDARTAIEVEIALRKKGL